jgi:hypothetical protein
MAQIQQGNILKGSFWPEKVRVISVKTIGENQIRIEVVGVETQRFYNPILSLEDIKSIDIIEEKALQFTGDGETVITGSFNFTKAAEENNAENLLIIHDGKLASLYIKNWEEHAEHSENYAVRGR